MDTEQPKYTHTHTFIRKRQSKRERRVFNTYTRSIASSRREAEILIYDETISKWHIQGKDTREPKQQRQKEKKLMCL